MIVKSRTLRIFIVLGVGVLLASAIGAVVAGGLSGSEPASATESATGSSRPGAVLIGFGDAETGVTMLYPALPGKVAEVVAVEGRQYEVGEVLLRLDMRLAQQQLKEAEAARDNARRRLERARTLARLEWEAKVAAQTRAVEAARHKQNAAENLDKYRQKQLKNTNILPEQAKASSEEVAALAEALKGEQARLDALKDVGLKELKYNEVAAQDFLAAKEAQLEKVRLALEECELKAPVKGRVLRVHAAKGEVLGPQPRVAAIEFCPTAKPLIVRAEVEQEFAGLIAVGDEARIQDDSREGKTWMGKVVRLSDWYTPRRSIFQEPLHYNDVRTMECIVAINPGQVPVRIGQRLRVKIGNVE